MKTEAAVPLHAVGGSAEYNDDQLDHGGEIVTVWGYLRTSTFWFESLQNWQSEFLSLFAMVFLSIWLREKESPESKEVNAPYRQDGEVVGTIAPLSGGYSCLFRQL